MICFPDNAPVLILTGILENPDVTPSPNCPAEFDPYLKS
jgi:hypothetical protein